MVISSDQLTHAGLLLLLLLFISDWSMDFTQIKEGENHRSIWCKQQRKFICIGLNHLRIALLNQHVVCDSESWYIDCIQLSVDPTTPGGPGCVGGMAAVRPRDEQISLLKELNGHSEINRGEHMLKEPNHHFQIPQLSHYEGINIQFFLLWEDLIIIFHICLGRMTLAPLARRISLPSTVLKMIGWRKESEVWKTGLA